MATNTQDLDLYGKDLTHDRLKTGYETHDAYDGQGDKRIVKALMMPVHMRVASPMFPDAEVIRERNLRRGEVVTVEELGLIALEKGERLGAFYTTAELRAGNHQLAPGEPIKVSSEDLDDTVAKNELGPHELVLWLGGESGAPAPTVAEVLDAVGDDADFAKRVIEAETTRDPDDPRKTLIGPLTKLAEGS